MSDIDWVLLSINSPKLTGKSMGGLPLISADLKITDTNNPEYFKLVDNALQIWAPQGTPVQVSWVLPKEPIGKCVSLSAFTGVNIEGRSEGLPAEKEFPTSFVSSEPYCSMTTSDGRGLCVGDGPTLTIIDSNVAPPGSKPPYIYEYSIVFLGSDAHYYLLDPPIRNER